MTAEIAANAANLLSDIKPGYMLGAKPRQQAIGHVIGIFSGTLVCMPLFFLLFLPPDANGVRSTATIVSDHFAFPAALQWKGVADLIARGISHLPTTAVVSMIVAAVCAAAIEIIGIATRGRLALSAVSIGLGVVLTLLFRFTRFGLATRASAETEVGALVSGLSPDRIALTNWIISFVVSAITNRLLPVEPASINAPMSRLRWVITPSNGATMCLKSSRFCRCATLAASACTVATSALY